MGFLSICAFVMVARVFANPAGVDDHLQLLVHEKRGQRVPDPSAPGSDTAPEDAAAS